MCNWNESNYVLVPGPVDELEQTLLQLSLLEPSRVERHHVGSTILIVVPVEIFNQPFEDLVRVMVKQDTLIHVGAVSTLEGFDKVSIQW